LGGVTDAPAALESARQSALALAQRESEARCVERWQALGVNFKVAWAFSQDRTVGGLDERKLSSGPLTVLVGDLGVGKSLAGERLHQKAIARALGDFGAAMPCWLRARDIDEALDVAVDRAVQEAGPVALTIDGLDEAGTVNASELLAQARRLVVSRRGSRVVLTTRPLPGIGNPDECREVVELDRRAAESLMQRIDPSSAWRWTMMARPLRDAARRPWFAIALATTGAAGHERKPSSAAEVLDALVRRALDEHSSTLRTVLMDIAVQTLHSGTRSVRTRELVAAHELDALLATRIVVEDSGRLRFPLILFEQWFAAQALLDGRVDLNGVLCDETRLEDWRYPLSVALALSSGSRVDELAEALIRRWPAFASIIISEATSIGTGDDLGDPLAAGRAIRRAIGTWLGAVGPLGHWIAPIGRGDGLPALGIQIKGGRISTAWWTCDEPRPKVFQLQSADWDRLSTIPTSAVTSGPAQDGPAWAWSWSRNQLAATLAGLIKHGRLPVGASPLERESLWVVANAVLGGPLGAERVLDIRPLLALATPGSVAVGDLEIDVPALQASLARHAENGWLRMPWPEPDRSDAKRFDAAMCDRAEAVLATALDGYAYLCRLLFPALVSRLATAVVQPALARGDLRGESREWAVWELEPARHRDATNSASFSIVMDGKRPATVAPAPRLRASSGRGSRGSAKRAPRGANRAAVLRVLVERPGVSASELSGAAGVARPGALRLLKTLEERGEVVKEQLPGGTAGYRLTEAPIAASY
jgi:hypothetical protein